MRFEIVKESDMGLAKEIWAKSFGDEYDYIDYYFGNRVPSGHIFGLRDESGLVSILCAVPMHFKIRDSLVNTAFISGVSTLPEKRGKGYISVLMSGVIPYLKEMGFALAYLSPAVIGMYEKYGFTYCTKKVQYSTNQKEVIQKLNSKSYDISNCGPDDILQLSSIYSKLVSRSSCIPERSNQDWEFILHDLAAEGGGILLAKDNDQPTGYLTWKPNNNSLESPESIFIDNEVFHALADKAFNACDLNTGIFTLPADSEFTGLFPVDDGMARIIDFQAVMQQLQDAQADIGKIVLSIADPLCGWNNGIFEIEKNDKGFSIDKTSKASEITMSIGSLTQWVCGSILQPFEGTVSAGKSNDIMDKPAKILPKKNCICFDKY
jgi:predicted acetyltransferase